MNTAKKIQKVTRKTGLCVLQFACILVFGYATSIFGDTIFSDNFDSAWPGSWHCGAETVENGNYVNVYWGQDWVSTAPSGQYAAWCAHKNNSSWKYKNDMQAWMELRDGDLSSYSTATLTFKYWMDTEANCDFFTIFIRDQYGNWHNMNAPNHANILPTTADPHGWSGNSYGWRTMNVDLSEFCGQTGLYVQFLFKSDYSIVREGVYIDDVIITAEPIQSGDDWDPGDDDINGATHLANPQTTEQTHGPHTILAGDNDDWFKVYLEAGPTYNFNSIGGGGDPVVLLYDPSLSHVGSSDDEGGNRQFSLDYTPTSSGLHYLHVYGYNGGDASYSMHYRKTRDVSAPLPPTGVSVSKGDYTDRIHLIWNPSSGATSYEVWRADGSDPRFARLLGEISETAGNDISASPGNIYHYWIKAKNAYGLSSDFSDGDYGYLFVFVPLGLLPPTGVSASDGLYKDRVHVSWNPSSGADNYEVWRGVDPTAGPNALLGTTDETSDDDTTATAGRSYYYWVVSKNNSGARSSWSSPDQGYRMDGEPPLITINGDPSSTTVNSPISLSGTASDIVGISSVTWRNNNTAASGVCRLTGTQWSINGIALVIDQENVITVTASDYAGNTRAASVSITYSQSSDDPPIAVMTDGNGEEITGGGMFTFDVTYSDNTAINISTIDNTDIIVTGPYGFNRYATLVANNRIDNATPVVATYKVEAPGGLWTKDDNGTYQVSMVPNEVSDTMGKWVPSEILGSFQCSVALPVSTTLAIIGTEEITEGKVSIYDCYATSPDGTVQDVTALTTWSIFSPEAYGSSFENNILTAGDVTASSSIIIKAKYGNIEVTKVISILPDLIVTITYSLNLASTAFPVSFSATVAGGLEDTDANTTFVWVFRYDLYGNAISTFSGLTTRSPSVTYTFPGTYPVVLLVRNGGIEKTVTTHITLNNLPGGSLNINDPVNGEIRGFQDPTSTRWYDASKKNNGLIIIIHGYNASANAGWPKQMALSINNRLSSQSLPNICLYDWEQMADPVYANPNSTANYDDENAGNTEEAYLADFIATRGNGVYQGTCLADWIIREIDGGLINPNAPIHLIAHSGGGFVAGECAALLPNVIRQITTLDTPLPIKRHFDPSPVLKERYVSSYYGTLCDQFLTLSPPYLISDDVNATIKIREILHIEEWGQDILPIIYSGFLGYYKGAVPGGNLSFPLGLRTKYHVLSHEWYRDTISDATQTDGFYYSPFLANDFHGGPRINNGNQTALPKTMARTDDISGFNYLGNASFSNGKYVLAEGSATDAGIYKNLRLPNNTDSLKLTFKYCFASPGDGDYLLVYFGTNVALYQGPDLKLTQDEDNPLTTEVDLSYLRGADGDLGFKLVSRGNQNAVLQVDSITLSGLPLIASADFDGDGKTDPAVLELDSATISALLSASGYSSTSVTFNVQGIFPVSGDFDGDGQSDFAVYYRGGTWYERLSSDGSSVSVPFGKFNTLPVPADYDGDGKTDLAYYHESSGEWAVMLSGNDSQESTVIGGNGYTPVVADYDGDGKADPAVYQDATGDWIVMQSSSQYAQASLAGFGGNGYVPVVADYDGDGKADPGIYHKFSGGLTVLLSGSSYTPGTAAMAAGALPLIGDFDGDGKADLATYLEAEATGQWNVMLSASSYGVAHATLGGLGFVPVQ